MSKRKKRKRPSAGKRSTRELESQQQLPLKAQKLIAEPAVSSFDKLAALWLVFLELAALGAWIAFILRDFAVLDPAQIPVSKEYLSNLQTHFFWENWKACGDCALWNGSVRGGYPALGDVQGSFLHPFVLLGTCFFGIFTGAKIALVGAYLMAGLGQWWLGWTLGLPGSLRLWMSCLLVSCGALSSKMGHGNPGLVLSFAALPLVLTALLRLKQRAAGRDIGILALCLASLLLAGQAYLQFAGLVILLPSSLLLFRGSSGLESQKLRAVGISVLLSFGLCAFFLLPAIELLGEMEKHLDQSRRFLQPLPFIPLNLLIDEHQFYGTEVLGKIVSPYAYSLFIGWFTTFGAFLSFQVFRQKRLGREILYFWAVVLSAFLLASQELWSFLDSVFRTLHLEKISGFRFISLASNVALPALIALSALGIHHLLHWKDFRLPLSKNPEGLWYKRGLPLRWLVWIPLVFGPLSAERFGHHWIATSTTSVDYEEILSPLESPSLQWVNTVYGEQFWISPALNRGLKLSRATQGWFLRNRSLPPATLEYSRHSRDETEQEPLQTLGGLYLYRNLDAQPYASIRHDDEEVTPCTAQGRGGHLSVDCFSEKAGLLTVLENHWAGWTATLDGVPVNLEKSPWLSVLLPAGKHRIQFQFGSKRAKVGGMLSLASLLICIWMLLSKPEGHFAQTRN